MVENSAVTKYPRLSAIALRTFSVFNIILWVVSTFLHVGILVPFNNNADVIGYGIWSGLFYGITGLVGFSASYKRSKSELVRCLVFSCISMLSSLVATVLAGLMGTGIDIFCYGFGCSIWSGLEWSLMVFSLLAFICNITVTSITATGLCQKSKPIFVPAVIIDSGNQASNPPNPAWVQQSFQQRRQVSQFQQPIQQLVQPLVQQPILQPMQQFVQQPSLYPVQQQQYLPSLHVNRY